MTITAPGSVQADSSAGGPVPPGPARGLVCRNCGATSGLVAEHACAECFGPLEVDYDPERMRAVTREQIEAGPQSIWRYAALLPVGQDPAGRVTLDPGMTPLVRADRLARPRPPHLLLPPPRPRPRRGGGGGPLRHAGGRRRGSLGGRHPLDRG